MATLAFDPLTRPFCEPDFENLCRVLMGGRGWRVPNAELVIDREIKDAFLGRPVTSLADEIEFRYRAGYDYAWISIGMVDPAGTVNKESVRQRGGPHFAGKDDRLWADEHAGIIASRADLERYPFPDPERLDYSPFLQARQHLRPGMKIIAILGKIFTAAWQLMGMEAFCESLHDDPALVRDLIHRIGQIQVRVAEKILAMDTVGGLWTPDDMAFHTGPLVAPQWLIREVFPFYRRIVSLCRDAGKISIFHSDGDITSLLDTIMATGFHALHPIEPESLDIDQVRRRVGKRLCLIGNISVHLLSTGTPAQIRELVRDRVQRFGHEGAYVVGSSNSVPNYVPFENYLAMLSASAEFGRIPQ